MAQTVRQDRETLSHDRGITRDIETVSHDTDS